MCCVLNCFMLSSLSCFCAFCWSAIPISCYIFNDFIPVVLKNRTLLYVPLLCAMLLDLLATGIPQPVSRNLYVWGEEDPMQWNTPPPRGLQLTEPLHPSLQTPPNQSPTASYASLRSTHFCLSLLQIALNLVSIWGGIVMNWNAALNWEK